MNIIFAQFGKKSSEVNPTYNSFKSFFPSATFTLYTDNQVALDDFSVKVVHPPFDKNHRRYYNHCNDYYKVIGLLESTDDISVAIDYDMRIVSDEVRTITPLTKRFGLCLPANPRMLVKVDNSIGQDGGLPLDESGGNGYITNMSPISFSCRSKLRCVLEKYVELMIRRPSRGPVVMWNAIWATTENPYILPPQWCVCAEHIGIGNEIILHVGHADVRKHYR